ncbi:hypothetical protein BBF96_03430 [Anoxybacter fermentans]|uniref:Uncharacterized protein n=1 Tax=Anoxybacter fermentans TaxID=1323375 RepID=A0A3Q9HPB5_9FIRM|nr:hypothetical protein [Anoxybacter fermentans]AZR72516.1 hypothetical protein BBF96_03430 [Anoxybacter fermentans]
MQLTQKLRKQIRDEIKNEPFCIVEINISESKVSWRVIPMLKPGKQIKKETVIPDEFFRQIEEKIKNKANCIIEIKIHEGRPSTCRVIPPFKTVLER